MEAVAHRMAERLLELHLQELAVDMKFHERNWVVLGVVDNVVGLEVVFVALVEALGKMAVSEEEWAAGEEEDKILLMEG